MENILKGQVIELKEQIDYIENKVNEIYLKDTDHVKLILISFDENTALDPHGSPGDALIIPLEGEGYAVNEGEDVKHKIYPGKQFVFKKGVVHHVEAVTKFKMLVVLPVEE
ncbi:hypothetical protein [Peptoniphilus obesi]|uniref:hypothetical protein n=1 Tax=Peptoniphilus obesi TaxID=1472765 RepID=UPI0004BB708F|nr:hypothetical protein [Peptoniphilus obesi]